MADQLEHELNELFGQLHVEQESPTPPPEGITIACLSHKTDRRDWQRLALHLEATGWQMRERCRLTWASDECDPNESSPNTFTMQAAEHIENAHIILIGLSVDMQRHLQQQPLLYNALFKKLAEAKQARAQGLWGQPPYIAGIRMKAILWDESTLYGMHFFPRYPPNTLAGRQHKDEVYVDIARQVFEWIEEILDERNYQANKE
jgi:hypothetical protein